MEQILNKIGKESRKNLETKYTFKKSSHSFLVKFIKNNSFRLANYTEIYYVKFILNLLEPSHNFVNYYWRENLDIGYYYERFNNSHFLNNLFNYAKENDFSGFLIMIPFYNETFVQHIEVKFLYYLRAIYSFSRWKFLRFWKLCKMTITFIGYKRPQTKHFEMP